MVDTTAGETKQKYGCVQCQKYHYEGDELFEPHRWRQSKHGIKQVSVREWTAARLAAMPKEKS